MNEITQAVVADIAALLTKNQWTVACAESCTGGELAAALSAPSGASAWFQGGVVAYSNQLKTSLLAVPATLIEQHGAVSLPVANAMANGIQAATKSTVSIATTGIAGPTGGSIEKPVGLVCMAWRINHLHWQEQCRFDGSRASVRQQACRHALVKLLHLLSADK